MRDHLFRADCMMPSDLSRDVAMSPRFGSAQKQKVAKSAALGMNIMLAIDAFMAGKQGSAQIAAIDKAAKDIIAFSASPTGPAKLTAAETAYARAVGYEAYATLLEYLDKKVQSPGAKKALLSKLAEAKAASKAENKKAEKEEMKAR